MSNNKILRKKSMSAYYVISVVCEDGCVKYINKGYYRKHDWDFTVKLENAMRFYSEESANNFLLDKPELKLNDIHKVTITLCID